MLIRQKNRGDLHIDGSKVQSGRSKGESTSINVSPPYFVGGLSEDAAKKAKGNVAVSRNEGFLFLACPMSHLRSKFPISSSIRIFLHVIKHTKAEPVAKVTISFVISWNGWAEIGHQS